MIPRSFIPLTVHAVETIIAPPAPSAPVVPTTSAPPATRNVPDIFAAPDLDPLVADEVAMRWLDRYEQDPNDELKSHLSRYAAWSREKGHTPFGHVEEIETRRRLEREQETLRDWEILDNDAGFDHIARERGFRDRYERAAALVPREELRPKLARDLFVQDVTGASPDEMRTGIPQLRVVKTVLKIDDPSDEAFDTAMQGYITKQAGTRDRRLRMQKEGERLAFTMKTPRETYDHMKAQLAAEGMTRAEIADSAQTLHFARERVVREYGQVIPLARKVFATVAADEGQSSAGKHQFQSVEEAAEQFARLPDEDFPKMVHALATLAEAGGHDVEGFFTKLGKSFDRGVQSYGLDLETFFRGRQAREFTKRIDEGAPILIPVDEGRTPREAALAAFRNLASGQGIDEVGHGADRGKERRPLRPMEREILRQEMEHLSRLQTAKQHLQDFRGIIAKVESDNLVVQGLYDATQSLPYMGMAFAGPVGMAFNGAVMSEGNFRELKAEHPDVDEDTLRNVADAAAVPQALIERFQAKTLFGKFPIANKLLRRLEGGGFVRQLAVRQGAEFTQELAQDSMLPLAQKVLAAFDEDVPEVDLRRELAELADNAPRTFFAVLPLSLIGAGGSAVTRRIRNTQLGELMRDELGMQLTGLMPDEARSVAAVKDPEQAAEKFRELYQSKTPEQRQEARDAAMERAQVAHDEPVIRPRTDGAFDVAFPDGTKDTVATESEAIVARDAYLYDQAEQARHEIDPEEAAAAMLPTLERADDGSFAVVYPDGSRDTAQTEEDALQALRVWESEESGMQEQAIREYLRHLEGYHQGNPELAARGIYTGREQSFEQWAKGSKERLDVAHNRVRIAMAQAGVEMAADERIGLSEFLILGSSRNSFGQGVTRIAMEINRAQQGTDRAGATVLTPIEEHAEGIAKWLIQTGKKSEEWMASEIRRTEAATGRQTLPANLEAMADAERLQQIVEAFSRLAVANAVGRVPDSQLSAGLKAIFRAIKEAITEILRLAVDLAAFRQSGQMDAELAYWLDVSAGINEDYFSRNMQAALEAEMAAEAMEGMPEIRKTLRGRLPHPETLEANNHPLAGEVRALHDEIRHSQESGASQAARTRKANEYFLPVGQMEDLDEVRRQVNQQGFDFETPAEMLDAAALSIAWGKPQFGTASQIDEDWQPSFSIGRSQVSRLRETDVFAGADGSPTVIGPASFSIAAFHGTPHRVDRFDTSRIGSGEGAQVFGWGLYFAAERRRNVPEGTRQRVSHRRRRVHARRPLRSEVRGDPPYAGRRCRGRDRGLHRRRETEGHRRAERPVQRHPRGSGRPRHRDRRAHGDRHRRASLSSEARR